MHGHPPYATALGATRASLELLTHDSVLFADGVAEFSDTPELIRPPRRDGPSPRRSATGVP